MTADKNSRSTSPRVKIVFVSDVLSSQRYVTNAIPCIGPTHDTAAGKPAKCFSGTAINKSAANVQVSMIDAHARRRRALSVMSGSNGFGIDGFTSTPLVKASTQIGRKF